MYALGILNIVNAMYAGLNIFFGYTATVYTRVHVSLSKKVLQTDRLEMFVFDYERFATTMHCSTGKMYHILCLELICTIIIPV